MQDLDELYNLDHQTRKQLDEIEHKLLVITGAIEREDLDRESNLSLKLGYVYQVVEL